MEEKKMKRTLAILLVLVMALCLFAACAKKEPAPSAAPANPTPAADRDAAVKFDNDSTPVDVAAVKASNADALLGRTGRVTEEIKTTKSGYVQIDGDMWKAVSQKDIAVGETVRVIGRESTIITVDTL